ncbi:MAG: hypothetical protein Q8R33_24520 [Burkholderiales bacterium]|nr:hypothetical protein [Burkholderiales bacterium]
MSMNVPKDTKDDHGSKEQGAEEQADSGLSGEGAASALAHMISRGQQQRHQTGEADDAAGSRHP